MLHIPILHAHDISKQIPREKIFHWIENVIKQLLVHTSSVRLSRYEACGKFGEHERCVRIAWGIAESNSSFLSALQTSQVLHISMNARMMYEPIVNYK